jgi:hypothetical protein
MVGYVDFCLRTDLKQQLPTPTSSQTRTRHERSALLPDQSEEKNQSHFAPVDVHSDIWVMGLRLGNQHAQQ